MSRLTGLLAAATISVVPGIARAQLPPPVPNLNGALIARIFGELPTRNAFALRDAVEESPLHAAAFHVSITTSPQGQRRVRVAVSTAERSAFSSALQAQTTAHLGASVGVTRAATPAAAIPVTAEYQPQALTPVSAASNAFSFPIRQSGTSFGFATQAGFDGFGGLHAEAAQFPLVMRVGNVRVQARFGAISQVAAANAQSEEMLPAFIAPYTSVDRNVLGAALAVPVTPRLMVGFGYDTERVLAGYQTPGLDGLDARNDAYTGRVTFLIPRFSSALSLSAEQYRYQDNLLQSDAYTQLRESLNLTVKF